MENQIETDIVEVIKEKKVAYQRELQVCLEKKHSHWDVYNALKVLEKKYLCSRFYRGRKWYWLDRVRWVDVKTIADKVSDLMDVVDNHPRRYEHQGVLYFDYAEFLVERALKQAGYVVVAKDTYYFNGVVYVPPAGRGRGRPPDLDFIVNVPEKKVFLGVQVKNQLRYPLVEDLDMFLDICQVLGVKPLLITRMAHEMQLKRVFNVGGRFVVFKEYLLKPPFPRDVFHELRVRRGFPIAVYTRVPGFLVDRLIQVKRSL